MGTNRTLVTAALFLAAGCAGCAASPGERTGEAASAIQGQSPDGRDTGVVGIVLLDEDGDFHQSCSGTLIAPNLVLTAQHCVVETARVVECASAVFGAASSPDRVVVTNGPSIWSTDASWLTASEVITPPDTRRVCGHDVALVMLSSPIAAASSLAPRLDLSPEQKEAYAAIGYGAIGAGNIDVGMRRRRDALHVVCVGGACDSSQVVEDEWRGDQGACSGDSGGPAIDGEGRIIGVTSRGPFGCQAPIYGALPAHASWLRDAARRAADRGGYEAPAWVSGGPDALIGYAASGGACAAARPGSSAAGSSLLVMLMVAAARRRRR